MRHISIDITGIMINIEQKGNAGPRLNSFLLRELCPVNAMMANILVTGFLRYNLKDWEGY